LRESNSTAPLSRWQKLRQKFLEGDRFPWLAGVELVELCHRFGFSADERRELESRLTSGDAVDGLKIAAQKL
jgi:hypothetical protein